MNTIKQFTNSIIMSIEFQGYYTALALALSLPDICGRLEFPEKNSKTRFIDWFNDYLLDKYSVKGNVFLSGEDMYSLRCAFLHQGESNIIDQRARNVLEDFTFVVPPKGFTIHNNRFNNTLQLQVDVFCNDVINGVNIWYDKMLTEKPNVIDSEKSLLKIQIMTEIQSFVL